jgi:hypothetical protein
MPAVENKSIIGRNQEIVTNIHYDSKNSIAPCNLMKTKGWFSELTSIEVALDLTPTWIMEEKFDGHITKCCFLPIHAAVLLKVPSLMISELI